MNSFDQSLRPGAAPKAIRPAVRAIAIGAVLVLLGGCMSTAPKVQVHEPTSAKPLAVGPVPFGAVQGAKPPPPASAGAIYQSASFRGLFEDRRARLVGDIITIQIQERHTAKRTSGSTLGRSASLDGSISAFPGAAAATIAKAAVGGSSDNTFEGKGDTSTDNQFTGSISVTVIEVLPNGNMLVSGEKQVGINQNMETLRFSGVVNPVTVLPGNLVSSTQVADARLEVRGTGDIDRAQTTGWLSRFFLSWMPI